MPIVRVRYVRRDYLRRRDRCGAAKEDEAPHVVGIVVAVLAVDSGPAEKSRMVDQVHRHAMRIARAQYRETFDARAESHRDVAQDRRGLDVFDDRSVAGHDQRRVRAGVLQRSRQRADHVGETAGFCVGRGFCRNDRYLHGVREIGEGSGLIDEARRIRDSSLRSRMTQKRMKQKKQATPRACILRGEHASCAQNPHLPAACARRPPLP